MCCSVVVPSHGDRDRRGVGPARGDQRLGDRDGLGDAVVDHQRAGAGGVGATSPRPGRRPRPGTRRVPRWRRDARVGGHRGRRRDAGHDLELDLRLGAGRDLLGDSEKNSGSPGHSRTTSLPGLAASSMPRRPRLAPSARSATSTPARQWRSNGPCAAPVEHDHVGLGEQVGTAQREQVRVTRPRAHERDEPGGLTYPELNGTAPPSTCRPLRDHGGREVAAELHGRRGGSGGGLAHRPRAVDRRRRRRSD